MPANGFTLRPTNDNWLEVLNEWAQKVKAELNWSIDRKIENSRPVFYATPISEFWYLWLGVVSSVCATQSMTNTCLTSLAEETQHR